MTEDRGASLLKRFDAMASRRSSFESHWEQVRRRFIPNHTGFQTKTTPGAKRQEWVFDSTAALALERGAAAMDSLVTPRTGKPWHLLKTGDDMLDKRYEVKVYLEEVNQALFAARYSPQANFTSQSSECYLQVFAYGTAPMYIEEEVGRGLRYRACHLSEIYIEENAWGRIDTVARKFTMTARQASQKWPGQLPEKIQNEVQNNPDKEFEFLHFVLPREDVDPSRRDFRGMPWASYYVTIEGKKVVAEGGFRTFPYAIARDTTTPREVYGRSRAMLALPDAKMQNEMAKTILTAAQMAVAPPLISSDEGSLAPFQMRPMAVNRGYMNEKGEKLVDKIDIGGDIRLGMEMLERTGTAINDALMVTLFQVLVDNPGSMTATEVLQRAQERGALLGPVVGRLQSEWLGPMIERELDILAHAGQLPEMPEILAEMGGRLQIEYDSPIMTALKAEEGMGVIRTVEAITPLAQIDPTVLRRFKTEDFPEVLAEAFGMPRRLLRTSEEAAAIAQQEEQAKALEQATAALPAVATATDKLAGAQLKRAQSGEL